MSRANQPPGRVNPPRHQPFARLPLRLLRLPEGLYRNRLTAFLGFPPADFFSTDYFSLLPWLFLFLTGYFLFRFHPPEGRKTRRIPLAAAIGRRSLLIYMLHQPVVYGVLSVLFR